MSRPVLALPLALVLLCSCRSHPCGEEEASPSGPLADAPLIQDGGKICHVDESSDPNQRETATIMYWGDDMAGLGLQYRAAFDAAGWAELDCGPYAAKTQLCFGKADQRIDLAMTQTETPRFGAKMWEPSVSISAYWTNTKE